MLDSHNNKQEERRLILAGTIESALGYLPKGWERSDEIHLMIREELRELDLLPKEPLGASFFRYIGQLVKPLRAGDKETQDFVKNWKGW